MAKLSLQSFSMPSKRLVASYVFDWIVIIAIAAVGGAWNSITPYHRPFSVTDLSISYPYQDEIIKTWILVVVGLVAPAVIILLVCLILVPGPTATASTPWNLKLRRKLWEFNAGWMGLGLSLATAFLFTQGMKLIFGKPRPHLLAVCNPNIDNISAHTVATYASSFSPEWVLVSSSICQQADKSLLDDGFKSFPSGHASFSWAGLLYLSLFLCSKFAIAIPFLPHREYSQDPAHTALEFEQRDTLPLYHNASKVSGSQPLAADVHAAAVVPIRNQAAAPPVWALVLAIVPVASAIYICSTRYAQYYHFGWDIIAGSIIGMVSAWFSFRLYHLPISRGAGWAWGARSRNRAFGIGVGMLSYVGTEGWGPAKRESGRVDVEMANRNGGGEPTL